MKVLLALILVLMVSSCNNDLSKSSSIPATLLGSFEDDYDIQYRISKTEFVQLPGISYNIVQWNVQQQYIITKNAADNPSEQNLFTRIDYVLLNNMAPYNWAFCYTMYNAKSASEAKKAASADKANPKKGCNGYPFSRMKKMD